MLQKGRLNFITAQLLDFHTKFVYNCRNICALFGTTNLLYSEGRYVPLLPTASTARIYANNLKAGHMYVYMQCCPTFSYIGAHLTDGCGGAGAVWRLQ
jgi:hypothetical protein